MEDASLSIRDRKRLEEDGWVAFKPSSSNANRDLEAPSFGWWWQRVYISDPINYYGQKHLEKYAVHSMDESGNMRIEHKVMNITLSQQYRLQQKRIRITNTVVEIVFTHTNANEFPDPSVFKTLNQFNTQEQVKDYLKEARTNKRKRRVKEVQVSLCPAQNRSQPPRRMLPTPTLHKPTPTPPTPSVPSSQSDVLLEKDKLIQKLQKKLKQNQEKTEQQIERYREKLTHER